MPKQYQMQHDNKNELVTLSPPATSVYTVFPPRLTIGIVMAPVTECAYITLKSGVDLESGSPDAKVLQDKIATLSKQEGCQTCYWGRQIENPDMLMLLIGSDPRLPRLLEYLILESCLYILYLGYLSYVSTRLSILQR